MSQRRENRRWVFLIPVYAALIGGGWLLGHWLSRLAVIDVQPSNESEIHLMVMLVSAAYVLASALPFVPGAEIGFALIAVLGVRIVFLVYLCMVFALVLAYCVGRFVPVRVIVALFDFVGLRKARDHILKVGRLKPSQRVSMMVENSPNRFVPFLLRHRYIALALVLNLPGNSLVGGGGGLALIAGMSGIFPLIPFVATVALAVAPLPLLILLTGYQP